MSVNLPTSEHPRVVIVGCGFGGLRLAQSLQNAPVQIVLLDRNNYHTFQPMLYQVATGTLEAESIAHPIREIFAGQENFFFRMTEAQQIDTERTTVKTSIGDIAYDYLVLACGSHTNFFGIESVEQRAMSTKTVPDALSLRNRIFGNLEKAVLEADPEKRQALLNIVVVGGGPTGVEISGTLGEMRRQALPQDYPDLNLADMQIVLVEASGQLLSAMSGASQEDALAYMRDFGVDVRLNTSIKRLEDGRAYYSDTDYIPTDNLIWAAGVKGAALPGLPAALVTRKNCLTVNEWNQVRGFANIFAIGDVANLVDRRHPKGYPMLAPVAQQQADQLAKNLVHLIKGDQKPARFRYLNKGTMAIMGRNKAVADLPGRIHFSGFLGWSAWLLVHLVMLIDFRSKAVALVDWGFSYFGTSQALRLIIRSEQSGPVVADAQESQPAASA